jgi:hypothetical protein
MQSPAGHEQERMGRSRIETVGDGEAAPKPGPAVSTYCSQSCAACGRTLRVRIELLGKPVVCQHCGYVFTPEDPGDNPEPRRREPAPLERANELLEILDAALDEPDGTRSDAARQTSADGNRTREPIMASGFCAKPRGESERCDAARLRRFLNYLLATQGEPQAEQLFVEVHEGGIVVRGLVASRRAHRLCLDGCRRIAGQRRVIDHLELSPPSQGFRRRPR